MSKSQFVDYATMTFYQDLSPYEYLARHEPSGVSALNIGWLDKNQSFTSGVTSQEFKAHLFEFCLDKFVVHMARGFHECNFCDNSSEEWYRNRQFQYGDGARCMSLGIGEIRVIGKTVVYAAPTLIYHYVDEHKYKPPDEFIDAVLNGPQPESNRHQELLQMYVVK